MAWLVCCFQCLVTLLTEDVLKTILQAFSVKWLELSFSLKTYTDIHSNGLEIFNIDCIELGGLRSFCCVPTLFTVVRTVVAPLGKTPLQ